MKNTDYDRFGDYYKNRVKVIGSQLMCFPADPVTLEPLACAIYDSYAYDDPDPNPIETISEAEWDRRRHRLREAEWEKKMTRKMKG